MSFNLLFFLLIVVSIFSPIYLAFQFLLTFPLYLIPLSGGVLSLTYFHYFNIFQLLNFFLVKCLLKNYVQDNPIGLSPRSTNIHQHLDENMLMIKYNQKVSSLMPTEQEVIFISVSEPLNIFLVVWKQTQKMKQNWNSIYEDWDTIAMKSHLSVVNNDHSRMINQIEGFEYLELRPFPQNKVCSMEVVFCARTKNSKLAYCGTSLFSSASLWWNSVTSCLFNFRNFKAYVWFHLRDLC